MTVKVSIHSEDARGNVFRLLEPLIRGDLTVPAGFESDGASVPRFFWRWVFPPGDTHAIRAAILHDYVYRTHPEGWTREDADKLFLWTLIEDGVPAHHAVRAYLGVRLFGWIAWRKGGGAK